MTEERGRPDDRVVVPDDVLPAGRGAERGRPPTPSRRRGVPLRFWFIGLIVAGALLVLGTTGIRGWWAHRLHDVTGGSKTVDFVIGLVVGVLPLAGIGIGRLGARGARRVMRMFIFGAAGFVATYLLSPSISRYASDSNAHRVFDQQAPGYLAGVLTAEALWLLVVVLAWWRFRRWRRNWSMRRQGPA